MKGIRVMKYLPVIINVKVNTYDFFLWQYITEKNYIYIA